MDLQATINDYREAEMILESLINDFGDVTSDEVTGLKETYEKRLEDIASSLIPGYIDQLEEYGVGDNTVHDIIYAHLGIATPAASFPSATTEEELRDGYLTVLKDIHEAAIVAHKKSKVMNEVFGKSVDTKIIDKLATLSERAQAADKALVHAYMQALEVGCGMEAQNIAKDTVYAILGIR